jgi:hypothetical protein
MPTDLCAVRSGLVTHSGGCSVMHFASATSRLIYKYCNVEGSRTDRNGYTCPLTTGQFTDGHSFKSVILLANNTKVVWI